MPAHMIVQPKAINPDKFARYREPVPAAVEAFGGRYLVRGAPIEVLEAGCAFVNCIPVFIAREAYWRKRFEDRNLPIIGDDIKSQVGATIVHRTLARLFRERHQLPDFLGVADDAVRTTRERERRVVYIGGRWEQSDGA